MAGSTVLAHAHTVIADRVTAGLSRPHLLVHSGDQLYADEVAAPVAPRIRRIAADLVGIDEAGVFGPLPPVGGPQAPSEGFGLTSAAASDHLWTFGEFLAGYLLAWSDALWPAALPAWGEVAPGDVDPAAGLDQAGWDDRRDAAGRFRARLPDARKVLATVPSLMVLDDHEVTDDWNLGHDWATAVYANPAGSRLVANGVLAYALCQHWGNVPERFVAAGTPEAAVLAGAAFTGASPDTPALRARPRRPRRPAGTGSNSSARRHRRYRRALRRRLRPVRGLAHTGRRPRRTDPAGVPRRRRARSGCRWRPWPPCCPPPRPPRTASRPLWWRRRRCLAPTSSST